MKPWLPPAQGAARTGRSPAYPPLLDELNAAWALLMARTEPIADDSLPDMRARRRPGTAMAAMMPMIATTISSSISVKPFWLRIFMTCAPKENRLAVGLSVLRSVSTGSAQRPTLGM